MSRTSRERPSSSRGAQLGGRDLIDTPGVYGVSSFNDEESVARDVIMDADVVVNVVDAVHLERDLFLTLQLIDMGKPMVVALNMTDEARQQGVAIDSDLLDDLLGVPVVETVATKGQGISELMAPSMRARVGHADFHVEPELVRWRPGRGRGPRRCWCSRATRSSRSGTASSRARCATRSTCIAAMRVDDIVGHVLTETTQGASFSAKLSHAMMHPLTGVPMLLVLL